MLWHSSSVLLLVLVLLTDFSKSQHEIVLGMDYELQLYSNSDEILQETAKAIHKLVPDVKYEGWRDNFTQEVDRLVQDLKHRYGLAPEQRSRRSISEQENLVRDHAGVFILQGIKTNYRTRANYPNDINIFSLPNKNNKIVEQEWYAVTLESKSAHELANELVIYKYNLVDSQFYRKVSTSVLGGVDVEIFKISGVSYLVVAEHEAGHKLLEGSTVYKIIQAPNGKLSLEFVQTLNTKFPWDITVWEHMNQVFLAVAQNLDPDNASAGESLVYRWRGQHFDLINTLTTYNANKVHYFNIGSSMFLAFANQHDNFNDPEVYSEIFKHNLHNDKFESYQRIKTSGAMDIKVFCFQSDRKMEYFMIIANTYTSDQDGKIDYHTNSVIYKLVDDYFIPFQNLEVPAVSSWEPIVSDKGEFVLLGASKLYGVIAVQHNGWRFVITDIKLVDEALELNVTSMRSLMFLNKRVVAIASKNNSGDKLDIIELKFQHINMLGGFHGNLETWCTASLAKLEQPDYLDITYYLEKAPKHDDALIMLKNITFDTLGVEELITRQLITPNGTINKKTLSSLNLLYSEILELDSDTDNLNDLIDKAFKRDEDFIIKGNLEFESLEIECRENCTFDNVQISTLNNQDFEEFMNQTVDTRENIKHVDNIEIVHLTVTNDLKDIRLINEVKIDSLIDKTSNEELQHPLNIYGHAYLDQGATVFGQIRGIQNTAVLKNGTLHVPTIKIQNLNTPLLNDVRLSKSNAREAEDIPSIMQEAIISNLIIDGLLSEVNVNDFVANSLKTFGNQTISGPYFFESLIVEDGCLLDGQLSNVKIPEGLALINEGSEIEVEELSFHSPLTAEYIYVGKNLNDVSVTNNNLRLLLRKSNETQHITAPKTLQDVHLTKFAKLDGTLNGVKLDTVNLTQKIINEDVVLDELKVNGKVVVDGPFYASEFYGGSYPISKLFAKGLLLTEQYIEVPLKFTESPVIFKMLTTKNINKLNPDLWLRQTTTAKMTGYKEFTDSLHIVKSFDVAGLVNGIDIHYFNNDVLKTSGDQIITGHKVFSVVSADSIEADIAKIGNTNWSNVLFISGDQNITGAKHILDSVFISEELNVDEMNVNGKVGGVDLEAMFADTLFHDEKSPSILGTKEFEKVLRADDILISQESTLNQSPWKHNTNDRVVYTGDVIFKNPTTLEHLYYEGLLDAISHHDFGKSWLLNKGDQALTGNQIIKNLEALNGVTTKTGLVNKINFHDVAKNAVYIDRHHNLAAASFDRGVYIQKSLKLDGKLQDVDIKTEVVVDGKDVNILGTKTFTSSVTVDDLITTHSLGGLQLRELCHFAFASKPGAVKIKGSVEAQFEPRITEMINNYDVQGLQHLLWYKDQNSVLTGFVDFQELHLLGNVEVQDLVDGVSLQWLEQNYFSKTRAQEIAGEMTFTKSVNFNKDVYGHKAYVQRYVGNLNINDFVQRVLLDGSDQNVVEYLVFNEIYAKGNIKLNGLLNNLNLSSDVMLTSQGHSVVRGKTTVQGINCKDIRLPDGATVQGVDVPFWVKKSVKTTGNFSIKGIKSITNSQIGHIEVDGTVDRIPFSTNNIMINGMHQTVTGQKTFVATDRRSTPTLTTNYLNIDGLLNDMDFKYMCSRIAYKNGTSIFTTMKYLSGPITAENVFVNGLYHGVNISSLHPALLTPEYLKDYEATFHQLMESARVAEQSISGQAVYLSHYKVVQTMYGPVEAMFPIYLKDSQMLLAVVTNASDSHVNIDILEWSDKDKIFITSKMSEPKTIPRPYYIYEQVNDNYVTMCHNETLRTLIPEYYQETQVAVNDVNIQSGKKVLSLQLGKNQCIVTLTPSTPNTNASTKIYCYNNGDMKLHQNLFASNPLQATAINIYGALHLFIIQGETPKQEPNVEIWKQRRDKFVPFQAIDVVNAKAIAATRYEQQHILAIASGLVQQAAHQGIIYILRYEETSNIFKPWTEIAVDSPTSLTFAKLPSGELVLYVLTESKAQPLFVFLYNGEEGFQEKTHATTIAVPSDLNTFTQGSRHFVTLSGEIESYVLEAVIKGNQL